MDYNCLGKNNEIHRYYGRKYQEITSGVSVALSLSYKEYFLKQVYIMLLLIIGYILSSHMGAILSGRYF